MSLENTLRLFDSIQRCVTDVNRSLGEVKMRIVYYFLEDSKLNHPQKKILREIFGADAKSHSFYGIPYATLQETIISQLAALKYTKGKFKKDLKYLEDLGLIIHGLRGGADECFFNEQVFSATQAGTDFLIFLKNYLNRNI